MIALTGVRSKLQPRLALWAAVQASVLNAAMTAAAAVTTMTRKPWIVRLVLDRGIQAATTTIMMIMATTT
jgi:cytochrome bd-type quinol oxidase subunit 1